MKPFLYAVLGLLLIAIVAVLVGPTFVNWNAYKWWFAEQLNAATGRDFQIDGGIEFSVLPSPALSVGGVRVSNLPGASTPAMADLEELRLSIALAPLLQGKVKVQEIALVRPVILFEVLQDGRRNWEFGGNEEDAAEPKPTSDLAGQVRLDNFSITEGTLVYRDSRQGLEQQVTDLNATIAAQSLLGPFEVAGNATVHGVAGDFLLSLGRFSGDGTTPVGLQVTLPKSGAQMRFQGALSFADGAANLDGRVVGKGADLAAALRDLAVSPDSHLLAMLQRNFSLESDLLLNAKTMQSKAFSVEIGETAAKGQFIYQTAPARSGNLELALSRLDLDAMLDRAALPPSGQSANAAVVLGQTLDRLRLPDLEKFDLDFSIDALIFRDQVVRQAVLAARLAQEQLTITKALALLPGGSDVTLGGKIRDRQDQGLQFEGSFEVASDNLRGLLQWLGMNLSHVPPDRFRKASLQSRFDVVGEQLNLTDIDLRLDVSRANGGVAMAIRERPAFGIGLAIDQLNLDSYFPLSSEREKTSANDDGLAMAGLRLLGQFDANIDMQVGKLTLNDLPLRGVRVEGTLQDGVLDLREASVSDLLGNDGRFTGKLQSSVDDPKVAGVVELNLRNLERLARQADFPSEHIGRLGPIILSGLVDAEPAGVELNLTAELLEGEISLSGDLKPQEPEFGLDLAVAARHPSAASLAKRLDWPLQSAEGPANFEAGLKGTWAETLLTASLDVLGGRIEVEGTAQPQSDAFAFDLGLTTSHPSLAGLVRQLAPKQIAAEDLGPFDLSGRLTGTANNLQLSPLAAKFADNAITGRVGYKFGEDRPRFNIDFEAQSFPLAALAIGLVEPGTPDDNSFIDSRWSLAPIDLDFLRFADASLRVATDSLLLGGLDLSQATLEADLDDGVLDLKRLAGDFYGGDLEISGKLSTAGGLAGEATLKATNVEVGDFLEEQMGFDRLAGPVTLEAELAGEGTSEAELVASLAGNGEYRGTLTYHPNDQGQALGPLSELLGGDASELEQVTDVVSVLADAFSQQPGSVTGTFSVSEGVFATADTRMQGKGAEALVTGLADLPGWLVDARAAVYRKDEDSEESPYLTTDFQGRLDQPDLRFGGWVFRPKPAPVPEQSLSDETDEPVQEPRQVTDGAAVTQSQTANEPDDQDPAPLSPAPTHDEASGGSLEDILQRTLESPQPTLN